MCNEITSALVGAIVGAFISYLFAINLAKKQEKITARAKLRATFANLTSQMSLAQTDSTIDKLTILNNSLKDLATAIELFRPYVPTNKQSEYIQSWLNYYSNGIDGKVHLIQYTIKNEINGVKNDPYKIFTERIDKILKFTEIQNFDIAKY